LEKVPAIKVAVYFVTFIVFGTMIILNLFIGIIMNSMSEMHAEIAQREAEATRGQYSLADEVRRLEAEMNRVRDLAVQLRRRAENS
jgi:voltage-gated sodium channel